MIRPGIVGDATINGIRIDKALATQRGGLIPLRACAIRGLTFAVLAGDGGTVIQCLECRWRIRGSEKLGAYLANRRASCRTIAAENCIFQNLRV
jgi:hypothetical protein